MPHSIPISLMWSSTSASTPGTPVDDKDYQVPFPFTGKISKLTVKLGPEELSPEEKKKAAKVFRDKQ